MTHRTDALAFNVMLGLKWFVYVCVFFKRVTISGGSSSGLEICTPVDDWDIRIDEVLTHGFSAMDFIVEKQAVEAEEEDK